MYVVGILEADAWDSIILADVAANANTTHHDAVLSHLTPMTLTTAETVAMLDAFYKDPLNLPIPIVKALVLVTMKTNGTPSSRVAEMVNTFRQAFQPSRKAMPDSAKQIGELAS
jgi:hypothetical protein